MDFSSGAVVRNPPVNAGDAGDSGSIPELGGSPGIGNGIPLQYSCLEKFHRQRSLVSLPLSFSLSATDSKMNGISL